MASAAWVMMYYQIMAYVRKTPSNIVYVDDERGKLERIDNVTYLTASCAECNTSFTRRSSLYEFNRKPRFYCTIDCLNASQRDGVAKRTKEATFKQRYGVMNAGAMPDVKVRKKATFLAKYGVENASQIPEVRDAKSLVMKRICAETDFIERGEKTMKERYGSHWLATTVARELLKEWSLATYGTQHHMQSPQHIKERADDFRLRHGVENPMQLEEVTTKVRQTCMAKYGVDNVFKRADVVLNRMLKRAINAKNASSRKEDELHDLLVGTFSNVERHVPIFYGNSSFWVIDFRIGDTYVQYDGVYWHGIGVAEDARTTMQARAWRRDRHQDSWFARNAMKLLRIDEVWADASCPADVAALISRHLGVAATYAI